jgi:hypothetical protein
MTSEVRNSPCAVSAGERYEACRVVDEGCSRAMATFVDMIDAVSATGVKN